MVDRVSSAARVRGGAILAILTVAVTGAMHAAAVPAALLLGPMIAGMVVAARGYPLAVPRSASVGGQAVVGCLISGSMAGALGPVVVAHWPLLAGIAAATLAASGGLGYLLSRWGVVPGTVAIWGSMPGGAAAMVLMAEANGADARLVAVMLYTRVVTVSAASAALAALIGGEPVLAAGGGYAPGAWWTMPGAAIAGAGIATLFRWPAGTLVLTMAIGVAAEALGSPALRVPTPVLVIAFAAIGWRIGLSFTGEARGTAARMLPRVILASLVLAGFCALVAVALHRLLGIDPLTAWLATSPGGLESVAAIASALPVDTPFIMAAQTARFGLVMLIGPALATALARRSRQRADADRGTADR